MLDPTTSCGPYKPLIDEITSKTPPTSWVDATHHDTIDIIAVDLAGNLAAGTTTNGATAKVPG